MDEAVREVSKDAGEEEEDGELAHLDGEGVLAPEEADEDERSNSDSTEDPVGPGRAVESAEGDPGVVHPNDVKEAIDFEELFELGEPGAFVGVHAVGAEFRLMWVVIPNDQPFGDLIDHVKRD